MSIIEASTNTLVSTEYPLDQWYVAGFGSELTTQLLARTLLGQPIVFFRDETGNIAALEDKCCHRMLPLSDGLLEAGKVRCGYHGLLFNSHGKCVQIPGQDKIPSKACVKTYEVCEQDNIIWIWFGKDTTSKPTTLPPQYIFHSTPEFLYDMGKYHYKAPWQLIHDNLMDLSHLGYVHLKTIGGDANTHMNAKMRVDVEDNKVKVVRHMLDSTPPPTYKAAWPFKGNIDRWQEIEFMMSHIRIWTGAIDANSDDINNNDRQGFHMRGFHGVTPETATTCHYFWSMATNPVHDKENIKTKVVDQTRLTFDEDKGVIESQFINMTRFGHQPVIDIHIDTGANQARRLVKRLCDY